MKIAIVVSEYNTEITNGLLAGAKKHLEKEGMAVSDMDVFSAPGAFEIPLIAQHVAQTRRYCGIVCLGCVIKGETAHFEYISQAATNGLMQVSLATGVPVSFGILTTYDEAQAHSRSNGDEGENKGREAAAACVAAVRRIRKISEALDL